MLRRYWLILAALGLTLNLGALAQDGQQEIGPDATKCETGDYPADYGEIAAFLVAPSVSSEGDEKSEADSQSEDTQQERGDAPRPWEWLLMGDLPAQAVMAWASIVAAFAGLVAAILLWRTLLETRLSDERQTRAYIHHTETRIVAFESARWFRFSMRFKNAGQTPARIVSITRGRCWTDDTPPFWEPLEPNPQSTSVGPGVELTLVEYDLSLAETQKIFQGQSRFFVRAHVRYHTAFDEGKTPRETIVILQVAVLCDMAPLFSGVDLDMTENIRFLASETGGNHT